MGNSHINKPFYEQKTFWFTVGSVASFGVEILNTISPFLPEQYAKLAVPFGGILAALGVLAARQGGAGAAREVAAAVNIDPREL